MENVSEPSRYSKFARASVILGFSAIVPWCLLCTALIVIVSLNERNPAPAMSPAESNFLTFLFLGPAIASVLSIVMTVAGMTLGILALRKKVANSNTAIVGIVINLICLAPFCLVGINLLFAGPDLLRLIAPSLFRR